jgi:hypothetical protein
MRRRKEKNAFPWHLFFDFRISDPTLFRGGIREMNPDSVFSNVMISSFANVYLGVLFLSYNALSQRESMVAKREKIAMQQ